MTFAGIVVKNLGRNKFRVVLTVLAVAISTLAFVLLRTVVWAWTVGADYAAKDRIVTRNKVTFVMPLPRRYVDDMQAHASDLHLRGVTWANWFGGKDPSHDREFFASFAVDAKSYIDLYKEDIGVAPDVMEKWLADKQGAVVGDVLARKMGWKVGDKVRLESGIYPDQSPWEFTIDGFYEAKSKIVDRSSFVFHWAYLNDGQPPARRDMIGWMVTRIDDPSHVADASVAIDKMFDEKEVATLSQDEHTFSTSFMASMSAVLKTLDLISIVILVIMALVVGNTIAMGVRERTNEYGVLRAIGFFPRHLVTWVVGEAVLVGAVGGALGLLISYPIVEKGMGRWLEENMGQFFPWFRIDAGIAAAAFGLALLIGLAASVIPAWQVSRLGVVDALRKVG